MATEEIQIIESTAQNAKMRVRRAGNVTTQKLNKAAKELSMVTVNAQGLRNYSLIGRFVDQIGLVHYGAGRLVGTADAIDRAIKLCSNVLEANPTMSTESKERFLTLQLALCKALDNHVEVLAKLNKSEQTGKNEQAPKTAVKAFATGSVVSPIQLNINTTGAVTVEKEQRTLPPPASQPLNASHQKANSKD